MRDSEVKYTIDAIKQGPANESPWRYLKGLFMDDQLALIRDASVSEACVSEVAKDPNNASALSFLVDLLSAGFQPTISQREILQAIFPGWATPSELAVAVCSRLESVDSIRVQYWAWRRSLLPLPVPIPERE